MESLAASVERRTFAVSRRGYDRGEVDAFLSEMSNAIAELEASVRDALIHNRELERRRTGTREVEESVESAYVAAAEAKQKLLSEAEDRAALILRDAEIEAGRLLADPRAASEAARKDAEGLLRQAQARLEAATEEAAAIRGEAEGVLRDATRTAELELATAREEAERTREAAAAEKKRILEGAESAAQSTLDDAKARASEVYEEERRRSIERFAASRDEYEELARRLRSLKEATGDMLTKALRDYDAIRLVLDDSTLEVG